MQRRKSMNENQNQNQNHNSSRPLKRAFSQEEKRKYYLAWEASGLNQADFCKINGMSKSSLSNWINEFKKEDNGLGFSPLVSDKQPFIKQAEMIQLNICFPNQMQLSMAMPEHRLVSFIQELSNAVTIVR